MKAASNVMRHYSVESTQKTLDWLAFGGTCCMIYGTRFGAYMLRKREEHQISSRPAATVYQMPVKPSEQSNSSVKSVAQSEPPVSHIAPEMEFESED